MAKMKTETTKSKCFLHESSILQTTRCLIKELLKLKGRNDKCIIINKGHSPVFISINIRNISSFVQIRWSAEANIGMVCFFWCLEGLFYTRKYLQEDPSTPIILPIFFQRTFIRILFNAQLFFSYSLLVFKIIKSFLFYNLLRSC